MISQSSCPCSERFAGFHASQCGYCTPGFVVAAHSVLRQAEAANRPPTADDFQVKICSVVPR